MKRIASIYKNQRTQLVRSSLAMLSFLILFVAPAMATHIVGGSISYRCLGNDQYEITVRVYRDCFNAAPGADFDDPASIGIFDRAGLLVADVRVPFVSEDTLTNIPNECLVIPGNVCVNTTTYVATVELPFREGGYQLVYQRCCRNETIQNLVNPLETGATYDIWLTEESMLTCNSSPVFKEWPPIFICVNDELNFDHSAIDADGDSLVYKLIAPLQGGTFAEPMPQPPNPPPYDEVLLIEPTYSVDNFLGFGEPLMVDQDNGLMTVTPSILGQFVVGVSVEEYDRETGELLSISRRDFQYNVIQCESFQAAFNAPEAVCDQFTVQFDNQTVGASEFLWNFSSADTSFTSSERSPEITFPDTGLYQVELIVDPGYVCETRFAKDIFVQTNSLTADFRVDVLACTDSSYLFLIDRSIDSVSAPVTWEWIISPEGMDPFTVNGQFPVVPVPMDSKGTIQLNVTSENNCMSSSTMAYEAPGIDLRTYLQDTIFACIGDQITLNPLTPLDVQLDYNWSGPGISDPDSINPMIEVQAGTTLYQLTISGPENSCFIEADIVVIGGERPDLDFAVGTNCDGLSYRFEDLSMNATSIEWIIGDLSAPLLITQETGFDFTFPSEGSYPVYLIGVAGCTDTLLRNIEIQNNDLDIGIDVQYTDCEADQIEVQLMAQTATTDSIISYDWRLSDGKTATDPNPVFSFGESQALTARLIVETSRGCIDSIEQELEINLITDVLARLPDTVALCDGVPTALFPENDDRYTYEWSPAEGLDDPTSSNPTFLQPGTYNVVISIPGSASCRVETQVVSFLPEAINLDITVSELPDDFDASDNDAGNGLALDGIDLENLEEVPVVDGKVISCSEALLLTAVSEPGISVSWLLNGVEVPADSLYYLAQATGENTYTAIATDRFGCTDTSTVTIDLRGVDIALPDQIAVCDGEPILVTAENTDPSDELTYNWSPADWVVAGQGTPNANFHAPIGINFVTVEAANQFGCTTIDSVEIVVVDPNHDLKFEVTSLCDSVTVRFTNQSENAFGYLWSFGDPDNPDATSTEESPVYTYPEPGTYTALLTLQYDVSCRDTFELTFTTTLLPPDLGLDLNLPDTLFTGGNPITVGTMVDAETYTWTDSSGQVIGTESSITVDPDCEAVYYLEVSDEFGCVYTDSVVVINEIIDVVLNPPSPVTICDGDQVQLMVENQKDCH
ncbi:MAG TPA: PKD domain-containing protein, partial [Saprospiraceae bacterium]|nr:PKD domain-containing protein [Saprospiraceae bacterium]